MSPETAATVPGVLATAFAVVLWVFAAQSARGFGQGQVGSLSWFAVVAAGVLSIVGPLVFCTGIVLRYRAESLGLRSARVKVPLGTLIRRFFVSGAVLVFISIVGFIALLISFHHHPEFISKSVAASLSSFARSAFVMGIVLTAAPLIAPFLITSPRSQLPIAEVEPQTSILNIGRDHERRDDPADLCLACLRPIALREA
jgi:hypothetical protein